MTRTPERARWLADRVSYSSDNCLIWPFSIVRGYGNLSYEGRIQYAHRFMCELAHGTAPIGCEAAHSCGNGHMGCVNPRHLSWKTKSENQADRRRDGTHATNKHGSRTRLTCEQIADIKRSKGRETQDATALRHGISRTSVRRWQRRTTPPAPPGTHPTTIQQRLKKAAILTADQR